MVEAFVLPYSMHVVKTCFQSLGKTKSDKFVDVHPTDPYRDQLVGYGSESGKGNSDLIWF